MNFNIFTHSWRCALFHLLLILMLFPIYQDHLGSISSRKISILNRMNNTRVTVHYLVAFIYITAPRNDTKLCREFESFIDVGRRRRRSRSRLVSVGLSHINQHPGVFVQRSVNPIVLSRLFLHPPGTRNVH